MRPSSRKAATWRRFAGTSRTPGKGDGRSLRRLLPEKFGIIGAARSPETDDAFRARMKQAVQDYARDPFQEEAWESLAAGMSYVTLDFADQQGEDELRDRLTALDRERGTQG